MVALTAVPGTPPALRELEQVLDVFRTVNRKAKDVVSDSRLQQLEWVASELAIALPLGLSETAGDSLADLLAPDAVEAYLLYGRHGFLRTAATVSTDPASYDTSERIRIFCLEAFVRQTGHQFLAPDLPPWKTRPTVSPYLADLITKHLEIEAGEAAGWTEADRPDGLVRGLAMWAVMRDVLPRLGEIKSMLLEDLDLDAEPPTLSLIRQPQGGPTREDAGAGDPRPQPGHRPAPERLAHQAPPADRPARGRHPPTPVALLPAQRRLRCPDPPPRNQQVVQESCRRCAGQAGRRGRPRGRPRPHPLGDDAPDPFRAATSAGDIGITYSYAAGG
ncbi:hypothetical protein ACFV5J_38640 [Streptomyces zaomyceticus]|uniref:hypothetical protein n=1 Tax=Streptomyces zaomyceticus TaxID=68286 RepID=UPI00364BDAF1